MIQWSARLGERIWATTALELLCFCLIPKGIKDAHFSALSFCWDVYYSMSLYMLSIMLCFSVMTDDVTSAALWCFYIDDECYCFQNFLFVSCTWPYRWCVIIRWLSTSLKMDKSPPPKGGGAPQRALHTFNSSVISIIHAYCIICFISIIVNYCSFLYLQFSFNNCLCFMLEI